MIKIKIWPREGPLVATLSPTEFNLYHVHSSVITGLLHTKMEQEPLAHFYDSECITYLSYRLSIVECIVVRGA